MAKASTVTYTIRQERESCGTGIVVDCRTQRTAAAVEALFARSDIALFCGDCGEGQISSVEIVKVSERYL